MTEQKMDLIKKYIPRGEEESVMMSVQSGRMKVPMIAIEEVPTDIAKQLLTGSPNVNPSQRVIHSPTMKEMVDIAEKHGGTMLGYVTPGKEIVFNQMDLPVSEDVAMSLKKELCSNRASSGAFKKDTCPKEVDPSTLKKGHWYFYWDAKNF